MSDFAVKSFALPVMAILMQSHGFAQDLTGVWQGTIHLPNRDAREVFKVSKDGSSLKAALFSIDLAPGQTFPSSPVAAQGASVKIEFPGIGATYTGTFNADGNTITGVFTQGQPMNLTLQRATAETAWDIPAAPPRPALMPANADPVFEVVTIKPTKPGTQGRGFTRRGRDTITLNTSLADIIAFAYDLHPKQIVGGQAWMDSDHYDVDGRPEGDGAPNQEQARIMLRKMMADRFGLVFHREKRELPVYALTVSKVVRSS